MAKKVWLHILEWAIAVAALVYLVWRLFTYPDYELVADSLRAMGWQQWTALFVCVLLMPVNMLIEAWRWKTLMEAPSSALPLKGTGENTLSLKEAQRQVYYSKLAGLITPWRLGEYPARALLIEQDKPTSDSSLKGRESDIWPRVLSMGAVGSATMTLAIVIAGVAGLAFSPTVLVWLNDSYLYAVAAVILVLAICLYFAPQWLRKYAEINSGLVCVSLAQSFVRLLCWCVQLALVLWAVNGLGEEGISGLVTNTFIYYLLVTITPNVPIVEVGVRGAWAMLLFGTPNAALAGVLLWAINTLLPCISWFFMRKTPQISARP